MTFEKKTRSGDFGVKYTPLKCHKNAKYSFFWETHCRFEKWILGRITLHYIKYGERLRLVTSQTQFPEQIWYQVMMGGLSLYISV